MLKYLNLDNPQKQSFLDLQSGDPKGLSPLSGLKKQITNTIVLKRLSYFYILSQTLSITALSSISPLGVILN
jgi:hypothetical protein